MHTRESGFTTAPAQRWSEENVCTAISSYTALTARVTGEKYPPLLSTPPDDLLQTTTYSCSAYAHTPATYRMPRYWGLEGPQQSVYTTLTCRGKAAQAFRRTLSLFPKSPAGSTLGPSFVFTYIRASTPQIHVAGPTLEETPYQSRGAASAVA